MLKQKIFNNAIKNNDIKKVNSLLKENSVFKRKFHPELKENWAIYYAMKHNLKEIVLLLLNDKRIIISKSSSALFTSEHKLNYYFIFNWAIVNGYIDVIELLLTEKRIQYESELKNYIHDAIGIASQYGHLDIIKLLLKESDINIKYCIKISFFGAVKGNHINCVEFFMNYPYCDPSWHNNFAITSAVNNNYIDIINLLLRDKRTDPSVKDNWCLSTAIRNKKIEALEILLNDSRINPATPKNRNIQEAILYFENDKSINQLIWSDQRVKDTLKEDNLTLYNNFMSLDIKSKIREF
jgi:hypothetical protein